MATENTMMAMASAPHHEEREHNHNHNNQVQHIEAVGVPSPVQKEEIEEIPDEDFYKQVLEQVPETTSTSTDASNSNRIEANYEAMTLKELKAEAKRKGIAIPNSAPKKDVIDALKRQAQTLNVLEPIPGSDGELEEGFPVELGESR